VDPVENGKHDSLRETERERERERERLILREKIPRIAISTVGPIPRIFSVIPIKDLSFFAFSSV